MITSVLGMIDLFVSVIPRLNYLNVEWKRY
jgi:hypothetical protein